jgi:hypothetical protein
VEVVIVDFNNGRPKCYTTSKNNLNNNDTLNNMDNLSVPIQINKTNFMNNTTSKIETCI